MSLLEEANMIKVYNKNLKKSRYFTGRIDLSIVLSLFILTVSPFIINSYINLNSGIKQIDLFVSPEFEGFFGKETAEALLKDFSERNRDLQIRWLLFIPGQSGEVHTRRGSRQNEKDREPDVFIFDEGGYNALVASGALSDLNFYTNNETGAAQRAIPLVSFMDVLFYNIELLTAAGFDRPPKTREEFLSYAKAVSGGGNVRLANKAGAAISLSPEDSQALSRDVFSWIWAAGGDFWAEENRPVLNNRAVTDSVSFLGGLFRERVFAPDIFDTTGEDRLEEFAQGRIAMMVASTRAIPFLRERMGDGAFGITAIPGSGSAGRYSAGLSGIYAGVNANCAYPDEAWRFLEFLSGQSSSLCEIFRAVPGVVSDIVPGDYVWGDAFYSRAQDIYESSRIVMGFLGNKSAVEYENAFLEEIRLFFENNRTVQETVAAVQKRWDSVSEIDNARPD
ncbi:MAG: extracellular solute-binding protein [Treponema sp.]|jgi:ABC-type glycerol-3-phosphate transport system substrate-binding protein|nr:extracellular solute-binding protein [Treponema sp.]